MSSEGKQPTFAKNLHAHAPTVAALAVTLVFHLWLFTLMIRTHGPMYAQPVQDGVRPDRMVVRLIERLRPQAPSDETQREHKSAASAPRRHTRNAPETTREVPKGQLQPDPTDSAASSEDKPAGSQPSTTTADQHERVTAQIRTERMHATIENAWTPRGESSLDTATRHGIEAVTVKGQIKIGGSVIADCAGGPGTPNPDMQGISIASIGCHGTQAPTPIGQRALHRVQTLGPSKSLGGPATSPAPADQADCARAMITGTQLPSHCLER
jgi:hypothetical protein